MAITRSFQRAQEGILPWAFVRFSTLLVTIVITSFSLLERLVASRKRGEAKEGGLKWENDSKEHRRYPTHMLKAYDACVLYYNAPVAWRVGFSSTMLPLFDANLSDRHIDIGVGSGLYVSEFPSGRGKDARMYAHSLLPALASLQFAKSSILARTRFDQDSFIELWDINEAPLDFAHKRLTRRLEEVKGARPATRRRVVDIMAPLESSSTTTTNQAASFPSLPIGQVKSISMMFLVHCLPYPDLPSVKGEKGEAGHQAAVAKFKRVLLNTSQLLVKGGRFAGCTCLQPEDEAVWMSSVARSCALALTKEYHRIGTFHNQFDSLAAIQQSILQDGHFAIRRLWTEGCVALWELERL
jgi:hypothetical protein